MAAMQAALLGGRPYSASAGASSLGSLASQPMPLPMPLPLAPLPSGGGAGMPGFFPPGIGGPAFAQQQAQQQMQQAQLQ